MLQRCEAFLVVPTFARTHQVYQCNKMGSPILHQNTNMHHFCNQLGPSSCAILFLSNFAFKPSVQNLPKNLPFQILEVPNTGMSDHGEAAPCKKNAKASWCRTFCNKTTCSLIWYPSLWKWENAYHFASTKLGQVCILMERIWTQILSVCGIHIHSETLTARKNTAVGTQVCEIRNVTGYAKFGHHRACRVWQFSQHVSFGDANNRVTMTRVSEPQRNEVNRFQKQWNSWPRLIFPNCFNLVLLPQTWFKTTVFTKVSLIEISPM